jgi:apolipoprotein N-acyltransferase
VWKKTSHSPSLLALLAGTFCVLAFPPINISGVLALCPFFFILAVRKANGLRHAFFLGFLTSFAIMAGGFYWVVYVLHVFGDMPWIAAGALYFLFCGFGALCFPFAAGSIHWLEKRIPRLNQSVAWMVVGIPALFTLWEFFTPKLFPWYVGHAFYKDFWINQVVEITGASFLTFLIFSWGGLANARVRKLGSRRSAWAGLLFPVALTLAGVAFSVWRVSHPFESGKKKNVALVQANIGSLDKLMARHGYANKLSYTVQKYLMLSEMALQNSPKPNLVLWPETAMPFSLEAESPPAVSIREAVKRWGVPLISGGYAASDSVAGADYNAAFLLEPTLSGELRTQIYHKNILLAFGEYFPGGERFPQLYEWFPQVSHFLRGTTQTVFELQDATRIGVTVCYEDISPRFFRKVTEQNVHAVVNLTNDSWFGPTSEPHQHGALAVFRAIENRTALARVTNTGISFVVDRMGRMSQTTPVYEEGVLNLSLDVAKTPFRTLYLRFGDWFIGLLLATLLGLLTWAKRAPLPF